MIKVFKIALLEELNCELLVGDSPRKLAHVCKTTVDVANNTVAAFRTALQDQNIPYIETASCDVFADEFFFDYDSEPVGVPEIAKPIRVVVSNSVSAEPIFFEKPKEVVKETEKNDPVAEEVFEEPPKEIRKRGFSKKK